MTAMNVFLVILALPELALGQARGRVTTSSPQASADSSAFRPLELPSPNRIREASGRPGPDYWQQRADYNIAVTLDTTAHTITGRETIRYHNRSPTTLRLLWLQLDQNLYRPDSRGAQRFPDAGRAKPAGFAGGYTIGQVTQFVATDQARLETAVNGTMLRIALARELAPGDSAVLQVPYSYRIPANGSERTGRERLASGWLYAVAQWFPRLAVFDDLAGWNTDEYLGQGEFYLEYGDIDYAITLPRNFIVAGTGVLQNESEVLTAPETARLSAARKSDTAVAVIARGEAGRPTTRPAGGPAMLTWRFHAANVRDVAWAASPAFEWDAWGWNGILLQALHPPEANADWSKAITTVRHTIRDYSVRWFPYPYPTATAVAAPLKSGMEYPMLVFDPMDQGGIGLERVVLHEIGHQWFPMIVGSNERRHAWMDEGFDTFINWIGIGRKPTGNGRGAARWHSGGRPGPIVQPADSIAPKDYDPIEYSAPDDGLELLRFEILDDTARFDAAFREYIRRWAFKHPSPADFFRTMNNVLGQDLSWFWRGWFYRTDVVDLAVDSVKVRPDSAARRTTRIYLSSLGAMPMVVPLTLRFADGTSETVKLPVDIWRRANHQVYERNFTRELTGVEIDEKQNLPDVRRANNSWVKAP
jgi:hypothetical protein